MALGVAGLAASCAHTKKTADAKPPQTVARSKTPDTVPVTAKAKQPSTWRTSTVVRSQTQAEEQTARVATAPAITAEPDAGRGASTASTASSEPAGNPPNSETPQSVDNASGGQSVAADARPVSRRSSSPWGWLGLLGLLGLGGLMHRGRGDRGSGADRTPTPVQRRVGVYDAGPARR